MRIIEERETTVELPEAGTNLDMDNVRERNFGNLIVLFARGRFLVTIGPHYYLFLPTFLLMVGGGCLLAYLVSLSFTNVFLQIFNAFFSILQCGAYLMVALSNPGIVFADNPDSLIDVKECPIRVCERCGARHHWRRVRHCNYCNVCVRGYDHHCPWVSKCIGSQNYAYFSFFVGITPLYIMYYIVILLICISTFSTPASSLST